MDPYATTGYLLLAIVYAGVALIILIFILEITYRTIMWLVGYQDGENVRVTNNLETAAVCPEQSNMTMPRAANIALLPFSRTGSEEHQSRFDIIQEKAERRNTV